MEFQPHGHARWFPKASSCCYNRGSTLRLSGVVPPTPPIFGVLRPRAGYSSGGSGAGSVGGRVAWPCAFDMINEGDAFHPYICGRV